MDQSALDAAAYWLSWIGWGKRIAVLCVAIGVAYEFLADLVARPWERTIDAAREAELARLKADAASAIHKAAEATLAAEQERLARIKIEEKLAPRRLSQEQRTSIGGTLAVIGRQRVGVILCSQTQEAADFANDIGGALFAAGMDVRMAHRTSGGVLAGIAVEIDPSAPADVQIAAEHIVAALRSERVHVIGPVDTILGVFTGDSDAISASIRVEIGEKP